MAADLPTHSKKKKQRLDSLVATLCGDAHQASSLIMAGAVTVDGQKIDKAGTLVAADAVVEIRTKSGDVGRGARKLAGALSDFLLTASGLVCADVGACTGGFTQILLEQGARLVYAIDVGYGALDYRMRTNPQVVVMERTNAKDISRLPQPVELVTVDVSFTSLNAVLPAIQNWMAPSAQVVALIKPQFEARREEVPLGGIVADLKLRKTIVVRAVKEVQALGFVIKNIVPSQLKGGDGNQEYFVLLSLVGEDCWDELSKKDFI